MKNMKAKLIVRKDAQGNVGISGTIRSKNVASVLNQLGRVRIAPKNLNIRIVIE